MATKMYTVRGVLSADLLLVCDPEKVKETSISDCIKIGVAGLAPIKVGRVLQNQITDDDPWGWEAREFVRKTIQGQKVKFTNYEKVDALQREVGEVLFMGAGKKVTNLSVALAGSGFVEIHDRTASSGSELAKQMAQAQIKAAEEKKGKYSDDAPRQVLAWIPREEHVGVIAEARGTQLDAVVEGVMSGHFIRVLFPKYQIYMPVQLTGVMTDKNVREGTPNKQELEKIGEEALLFTERSLYNKDVKILVDGDYKGDVLLGSIVNGDAVFQEALIKNGYARVFDQTIGRMSQHSARLMEAEKAAKGRKQGRWAHVPEKQLVSEQADAKGAEAAKLPANFTGRLLQVQTPDTLFVLNDKTQQEMRVSLANVRGGGDSDGLESGTRNLDAFSKQSRDGDILIFENFFLEGRDFVARRLQDKALRVEIEFIATIVKQDEIAEGKPLSEPDQRTQVTIYYQDGATWKNIGTELIEAGLASLMPSKDGRAKEFAQYAEAFLKAKDAKRGIHGNRSKEGRRVGDHKIQDIASGDKLTPAAEKKGRAMLGYLQRSGGSMAGIPKLKAFVEYVLGPARFKLYIPRENCQLSLNIAGIASPSMARTEKETSDPFGQEAINFSKLHFMQREVEVRVDHYQKGTFVGNVWVLDNETKQYRNVAQMLLEEGLATMEGQNTQSMVSKGEAVECENRAKEEKKGIWGPKGGLPKRVLENMERSERRSANRVTMQIGTPSNRIPATVTEILDSTTFFFQQESSAASLSKINSSLHQLNLDANAIKPESVKPNTLVAARFTDKKWYRGMALKKVGSKMLVNFIDFGNKLELDLSDIRECAQEALHPSIPGLAQEAHVAFMWPIAKEVGVEGQNACFNAFADFVEGRKITVAHEYTNQKKKYYTVRFGEKPVQADLIKRGFGLVALEVQSQPEFKKAVDILMKLEASAKRDRIGLWSGLRGDPRSDEM